MTTIRLADVPEMAAQIYRAGLTTGRQAKLMDAIASGQLRVVPAEPTKEMMLTSGCDDALSRIIYLHLLAAAESAVVEVGE